MGRETVEARWRERIQRWRSSGLSIRQFCRRDGVGEPAFYSWRKRLAASVGSSVVSSSRPRGRTSFSFLPVEVLGGVSANAVVANAVVANAVVAGQIEIVLSRGVTIRVGGDVDESRLRGVLRLVVEELPPC